MVTCSKRLAVTLLKTLEDLPYVVFGDHNFSPVYAPTRSLDVRFRRTYKQAPLASPLSPLLRRSDGRLSSNSHRGLFDQLHNGVGMRHHDGV
jgi:hypothetical protein